MNAVLQAAVTPPAVRREEVLRYAGAATAHGETIVLMESCIAEMEPLWRYAVCYTELPVTVTDGRCDFGAFAVRSASLAAFLAGTTAVWVMAATVGTALDRRIQKYAHTSPSRALMLQALGAERIEALCDAFCAQTAKENGAAAMPRFSPGYGDLPLSVQRDVFAVLDCSRHIGVSLTDGLMMVPTKSVTAFAVLSDQATPCMKNRCSACQKRDCAFRGDV